jgi:hypothetical protein
MLGGELLELINYKDAEPLLLEGYDGMKQRERSIPAAGKKQIVFAVNRLVRLCAETGIASEAKRWQDERAKYPGEQFPMPLSSK